jgi:hypothetical protein
MLHRDHTFNWLGRRIRQREQLYLIETARFEPQMNDAVEARVTAGFYWWTLDELRATTESVTPRRLAQLIDDFHCAESKARGSYKSPLEFLED